MTNHHPIFFGDCSSIEAWDAVECNAPDAFSLFTDDAQAAAERLAEIRAEVLAEGKGERMQRLGLA